MFRGVEKKSNSFQKGLNIFRSSCKIKKKTLNGIFSRRDLIVIFKGEGKGKSYQDHTEYELVILNALIISE